MNVKCKNQIKIKHGHGRLAQKEEVCKLQVGVYNKNIKQMKQLRDITQDRWQKDILISMR